MCVCVWPEFVLESEARPDGSTLTKKGQLSATYHRSIIGMFEPYIFPIWKITDHLHSMRVTESLYLDLQIACSLLHVQLTVLCSLPAVNWNPGATQSSESKVRSSFLWWTHQSPLASTYLIQSWKKSRYAPCFLTNTCSTHTPQIQPSPDEHTSYKEPRKDHENIKGVGKVFKEK